MLYLQHPNSFPNVDAQQKISQWRANGYPEAGLAQVLLCTATPEGTYDQHLDAVESICRSALASTDICYVELATVSTRERATAGPSGRAAQATARRLVATRQCPADGQRGPSLATRRWARRTRRPPSRCWSRSPPLPGCVGQPGTTAL